MQELLQEICNLAKKAISQFQLSVIGWKALHIKQSKLTGYQIQLTRNSVGSELEIEYLRGTINLPE